MEIAVEDLNKKLKRKRMLDDIFRLVVVILSSAFYAVSVEIFLEPANLLSIGSTAIGQIINRILTEAFPSCPEFLSSVGLYSLLVNIPLLAYGVRHVSPRFAFYTVISVVIQFIFLAGWIDGEYILTEIIKLDPESNRLFLSIIAGLLCGVGMGIALRYGTSTGGLDIVSQALSLKKGISIGTFSMVVNILLAIINGAIAHQFAVALYTFIFIILSNIVIDKIHTAYNYLRIDVITKKKEEVSKVLLEEIKRGCTTVDVQGAYTNEMKFDVFMVISSYELEKAKRAIHKVDPEAFIMVSPIKRIIGAFFKHTIA